MKQINPVTEVRHHQNESIDVQMNHLFVQSYRTQRRRTLLSLQKSQLLNYYFCLACIRIPLRVESVAMILPISLPVFCEPYLFLILKKNYIISLHLFPSRTTTSHLSHRSLFIYLMSNHLAQFLFHQYQTRNTLPLLVLMYCLYWPLRTRAGSILLARRAGYQLAKRLSNNAVTST